MNVQVKKIQGDRPAQTVKKTSQLSSTFLAVGLCALTLLPILVLIVVAMSGSGHTWPHLLKTVLPRSTLTTLQLLVFVAIGAASIGVTCAWLTMVYEFPGRKILAWALMLPFAVPPYLAAYAFAEFFHFTGPPQTLVRWAFDFHSARDYWFPDIRSTFGAAIVLSSVLFPYVYMTTRVVFVLQGRNLGDAARTLGAHPARVVWRVILPIARPAIMVGVVLVLMETLNDIGAVEFLGVQTLTFAVYDTWLNRSDLEGAAQIACIMLVIVFALVMSEQWARRKMRFFSTRTSQVTAQPARVKLNGTKAWAATILASLPVFFGFGIPIFVLGGFAMRRLDQIFDPQLQSALFNSIWLGVLSALFTVILALIWIILIRATHVKKIGFMARLAVLGYAMPGTILGLGLLFALTWFDNALDGFMRLNFNFSTGLLLTGSAGAIVYACSIRFLALSEGTLRSSMEKLPPNLDDAARSLGRNSHQAIWQVLLPLLRPALLTAGVLVFVDTIKELSATILLRPFGFSTLSTYVYENASRGVVEDGAIAALAIIATALVPVLLLARNFMHDRPV